MFPLAARQLYDENAWYADGDYYSAGHTVQLKRAKIWIHMQLMFHRNGE
jgi:hypothetical protein